MSTYDWLTIAGIRDVSDQHYVEVAFKNGARKEFFYNPPELRASTGDRVVCEVEHGFDTGQITLSGELVLAQMRRRKSKPSRVKYDVLRLAHARDCERFEEARRLELETLVRARTIAYATELPLKMSDVEYQGDLRKATFYYTSNDRIDFRELIKSLAREFKVRVEMRQIGDRQETARLGGIGSCGRELCCSTWLTDFKSVNTAAARYQGLALNQTKLSGQCGRLKCCLNYELDTYLDALEDFPRKADTLRFESGKAVLVKTDVFKRLMHYQIMKGKVRGPYITLTVDQVHEVIKDPEADVETLLGIERERQLAIAAQTVDETDYDADLTGVVDIPLEKRQRKSKNKRRKGTPGGGGSRGSREGSAPAKQEGQGNRGGRRKRGGSAQSSGPSGQGSPPNPDGKAPGGGRSGGRGRSRRNRPRGPKPSDGPKPSGGSKPSGG